MRKIGLLFILIGSLALAFSVYSESKVPSEKVDQKDFEFIHPAGWADLLKAGMGDPNKYAVLIQNPDGTARFGIMVHDFSNSSMKKIDPSGFYNHVFYDLGFDVRKDEDLHPEKRVLTETQLKKFQADSSHTRTYSDPDKNFYKVTLLVKNLKVFILLETAMEGKESLIQDLTSITDTFKLK